jgi:hypothetical protein
MLDLLDDTFKLTIDKVFHGKTLTPEEIETETEFELLVSHDQKTNKRSDFGLVEPRNKIFPDLLRGLYPSDSIYQRLIKNQNKHLKKHLIIKNEEIKQQ